MNLSFSLIQTNQLELTEFLSSRMQHILSALLVVFVAALLLLLVDYVFRFLIPKSAPKPLNTILRVVRRVAKASIIFFGLITVVNSLTSANLLSIESGYYNLVISILVIGLATAILASISRALFTNLIDSMERQDKDITKYTFLRAIIESLIYFLGIMAIFLTIPGTENYAKTILGGAGILALIAGFAAQETVSNVLAGVFIIFSKPFKIGDTIKVSDNMMGTVWDISLRHTIIKDYDNKMIVIPNSIINKEKIFNYSLGDLRACERIDFEIGKHADVDLARKIMEEEVAKHPLSIDVRNDFQKETGVPRVTTKVTEITTSGVIVKLWAWAAVFEHAYTLRCDLIDSIKKRFDLEGIDMPYPHRTVVMKQTEENT